MHTKLPNTTAAMRKVEILAERNVLLDFKDSQQEIGTPLKPLPPVEQSTNTP